jgi:hypothetical protein
LLRAMQARNVMRVSVFIVFFGIGVAALGGSALCPDLIRYYHSRDLLNQAQASLDTLELLNADYDALLQQLQQDPNLVRRIAPATLGAEPEDPNAVYPTATVKQLTFARKALTEHTQQYPTELATPTWLIRCSEPRRRTALFLAGAGLILISIMYFGPAKEYPRQDVPNT